MNAKVINKCIKLPKKLRRGIYLKHNQQLKHALILTHHLLVMIKLNLSQVTVHHVKK